VTDLTDRVRTRLASAAAAGRGAGFRGIDLGLAGLEAAGSAVAHTDAALDQALREETEGVVDDTVFTRLRQQVAEELTGAGPLEPLLALPGVTDVLVNGPRSVWIDRGDGLEPVDVEFPDDAAVRRLAQRLANAAGRRLDDAEPCVDAVLPDGTRMHAVLPPICSCTTVSLRVLARRRLSLPQLVRSGSLPSAIAQLLAAIVPARLAFVITGGTGSGKTTLLSALLATVPAAERILLIEDSAELTVDHPHVVRLLTRAANVEGAGGIGLRELVRQSLRMRPDRLVVGEFRGPEMGELLVALNSGHEGGAATMHANSAADVPARFLALGALAGLSPGAVAALAGAAVDLVVHLRRARDGVRRVSELAVLGRSGDGWPRDGLAVVPVWSDTGGWAGGVENLIGQLRSRGVAWAP
jgi:pilus assembly protein CpaF